MHHELLTGVILRPLPGGSDDVDDVVVVQSPVRANWFLARGRVHATSYLCVSGSGNVGVEEAKSRVVIMEVSYCPVIGIAARGCGAKVEILAHHSQVHRCPFVFLATGADLIGSACMRCVY